MGITRIFPFYLESSIYLPFILPFNFIVDKPSDVTYQSVNVSYLLGKDHGIQDSDEKQLLSSDSCGNTIENAINENIYGEYINSTSSTNLKSALSSNKNAYLLPKGNEPKVKSIDGGKNKRSSHDKSESDIDESEYDFPENESALKQMENMMGRNYSDFMRSLASKYNKE